MSSKVTNYVIPDKELTTITTNYGSLASGATLPCKEMFPDEFKNLGINPRNPDNNDYWGYVLTRPNINDLVFGFVYFDKTENKTNEDIYVVDTKSKNLKYYSRGSYEKLNPDYKNTHKEAKDCLKP